MSKKGRTRRKGAKGQARERLLDPEQRREILAFALLALAILLLLALFPVSWLGARAASWFPSGNAIGSLGSIAQRVLLGALGVGAVLLPLLLGVFGLVAGGWLERIMSRRLVLLGLGLTLLVPGLLEILVPGTGGALGTSVASWLTSVLGWLGAVLVISAGLVILSVATLKWNPVRPLGRAVLQGGGALGRSARKATETLRTAADATGSSSTRAPSNGDGPEVSPASDRESTAVPAAKPPARKPARKRKRPKARGSEAAEPMTPKAPDDQAAPAHALPTLQFLTQPPVSERRSMEEDLEELGQILVDKLKSFSVDCTLGGRTTGPVVTQYEIVPAPGVKVNRIANLDADLALAMKARSIRIVAPIPGKGAVGVEIPNPRPQIVFLSEVLGSSEFSGSRMKLPLALGRDLNGLPYVADLTKMPHVLIAGATGSGKSVCLNTVITSLIYRHTPDTLRLLLIDPKMVELSTYSDLPHLRHAVVTDPKDAAGALKWAVLEMERRYGLLSQNGVRSMAEFNKRVLNGTPLRRVEAKGEEGDPDRWLYQDGVLPYVVVVVDELADLMMTVQSEVERPLTQLAQKARAIGIHLIVATQRPSVNVITGLIKANFPTRIAFRVASKTDSRTILDQNGADALLGNGDMLFLPPGESEPVRMQGAFIPTEDTDRIMQWYRAQRDLKRERAAAEADAQPAERPESEEDILEVVKAHEALEEGELDVGEGEHDYDELFRAAAEVCIQNEQGSTSLLQRKLRVGYGRAARIVDQLHEAGVLGPPAGSKPREVLIGMDGLDLLLSGLETSE